MKTKKRTLKKKILYGLLGLVLLGVIGSVGGALYMKHQFFRDRPNALTFEGDLFPVPFQWSEQKFEAYTEPYSAMLIPVSVPGLPNTFYMQFDTGSPYTYLRSGCLESLKSRGIEFELLESDGNILVKQFELNVGGNRVVLNSGPVMKRSIVIDWETPNAINVIGSIGSDFIDQKICAIDFPSREIRLYESRPDSLNALGEFSPFSFPGRRVMLPAVIDGSNLVLLYDSGCSPFGLLTSKYHFNRYTDPNVKEINFDANRRGESIPVHHKPCDMTMQLGGTEMPLKRVSYVEMYGALQATVGRFSNLGGLSGFLGNQSLTESTLILDTKANEFLVVNHALADSEDDLQPVAIHQAAFHQAAFQKDHDQKNDDEVTGWIKSAATAIQKEQESFGQVEKQASAARVVGLGEATHGQHESFDLKRRLTMNLIRNHGFRVVAYEASASRAIDCDDYISDRMDDREKAISGLGMLIWQVEENGRLLDDLKKWNKSAGKADRVRFIGCDAQSGNIIIKRISDLFDEENSVDENANVTEKLTELLERSDAATKKAHSGDLSDLEKLIADANIASDGIRKLANDNSLNVTEVDLRMQEFIAHLGLYGDMGARDKAMAELLLAQLDRSNPQDKCVFWGHNAHVQRTPLSHMRSDALAMGGHLAQSLGQEYYALGFAFGAGEFQANELDDAGKWRFRRYTHSAAPAGSLDAFLGDAFDHDFLLDFRSAPDSKPIQSWLQSEQGHRWWGGYNVPEDFDERTAVAANLSQCTVGQDYDGIAFHHHTSAATPVNAELIVPKQ